MGRMGVANLLYRQSPLNLAGLCLESLVRPVERANSLSRLWPATDQGLSRHLQSRKKTRSQTCADV